MKSGASIISGCFMMDAALCWIPVGLSGISKSADSSDVVDDHLCRRTELPEVDKEDDSNESVESSIPIFHKFGGSVR